MNKRLVFAISVALNVALIGFGFLYVSNSGNVIENYYSGLDDRIALIEEKMENLKMEVDDQIQNDEVDVDINSEIKELDDKIQVIASHLNTLQANYNKLRIYKEKLDEIFQIK